VFVLQQVGPDTLHNVEVILHDNHQKDQTAADHIEHYSEITPGESNLKNIQPKHFWFKPSTPWDEDYNVTIKTADGIFLERILVRGFAPPAPPGIPINPPPAPKVEAGNINAPLPAEMGKVEFAIRVAKICRNRKALFTCQDTDLLGHKEWRNDPVQPCSHHCTDIPGFEAGLDPKPFVLSFPAGVMILTEPVPPIISSHPETETDTRRLSDWQKGKLRPYLERYPNQKVLIVFVGGASTRRYAQDFVNVFRASKWKVKGPIPLTVTATLGPIIDVQISTWIGDFPRARQTVMDILYAFKEASIKSRERFVCSLNRSDVLVILVGAKSPDGECPSDYPPHDLPEINKLVDKVPLKEFK
jgi:hypothetical protein